MLKKVLILGVKFLTVIAMAIVICAIYFKAHAHDPQRPELNAWFDKLTDQKGQPCCSLTDGIALSDVDWDIKDGHYRVRVPYEPGGKELIWKDVPDESVITEPNKAGKTMVWPLYGYLGFEIRCFMPGSMG
jgi:hypothetical protein